MAKLTSIQEEVLQRLIRDKFDYSEVKTVECIELIKISESLDLDSDFIQEMKDDINLES